MKDKTGIQKSFSIFHQILFSFLISGLIVIVITQINNYFSFKTFITKELKLQVFHSLEAAITNFDITYAIPIKNDLDFIQSAYSFDSFLSSQKDEALLTSSLVERLFLHFTSRSKGIYLSLRFIDMEGVEKIVTEGNRRIKKHVSLAAVSEDVFYQRVLALFSKIKTKEPGVIFSEEPFKYRGKDTFLVGTVKRDPETGGRAGVVIFHCDLTTYFHNLEGFEFYGERMARVVSLDNKMIFSSLKNDAWTSTGNSDFYTLSSDVKITSNNQPLFKVVFSMSQGIFRREIKSAFLHSFFFILLVVVIMSAVAFVISNKLSLPLVHLADSAKRLARGDLSSRVDIKTTGEIQLLADAFNQMVEDLQKTTVSVKALEAEQKRFRDISEALQSAYDQLKTTQAQLIQSAKMASVGLLAGGVAHEINNPLTGVLNSVQLIKMTTEGKKVVNMDELKDLLDSIEESGLRCTRITRALLDFSHASKGTYENLLMNNVAEKAIIFIEHELHLQNIVIKKDFSSSLPLVYGDSQLLQQVVFDIIANAQWAIQQKSGKKGGTIVLNTFYEPKEKHVCVTIFDTGLGIPGENLVKIFDPFFTTKPVGVGTGLGLSIVYNIVKRHHGSIKVESNFGESTTFTLSFPVVSV